MRHLTALFLALLLIPSLGTADAMYKWVDAQGNVHYSDKSAPGATKIDVPKVHTFTPPAVAAPEGNSNTGQNQPRQRDRAPTSYSIGIDSPQDQETLWNVTSVTISVSVSPALHTGDRVTITLDGTSKTVAGTSASFDVDRGEHTAMASINGASASAVTFFVQKASAKKPPAH